MPPNLYLSLFLPPFFLLVSKWVWRRWACWSKLQIQVYQGPLKGDHWNHPIDAKSLLGSFDYQHFVFWVSHECLGKKKVWGFWHLKCKRNEFREISWCLINADTMKGLQRELCLSFLYFHLFVLSGCWSWTC